jgi:hypothetical protein
VHHLCVVDRTRNIGRALAVAIAFAVPVLVAQDVAASGERIAHEEAVDRLGAAGIPWSSSGGCSDRAYPECTSFEDIYSGTIDGVITLQRASGCPIRVTGGTEAGHLPGRYSHEAGYKVDIALGDCVGDYIRSSFQEVPPPEFGTEAYRSAGGNEYTLESDHWDILYY